MLLGAFVYVLLNCFKSGNSNTSSVQAIQIDEMGSSKGIAVSQDLHRSLDYDCLNGEVGVAYH